MTVLLVVLLVIGVLIATVLLRTAMQKPTAAKTVVIEYQESERSEGYGQKLSQMIQCETVSSRDNMKVDKFYKFQEVLEQLFPRVFTTCIKTDIEGSLLLRWQGKASEAPILLMSHQDVVEAPGEWTHPPFSGDVEDGVVWGRGTVDTKGNLFCILQSVEELIEQGYIPEQDIYVASSNTEEIRGEGAPKTVAYLKAQGVRPKLLLDEGGMILENPIGGVNGTYAMVGVLEKGYGDLEFTARGTGGHASAPGKNTPLVRIAKFMAEVEEKSPFKVEFYDSVTEMFRRLTPNMVFPMKLVFANLWCFAPILKKVMPSISPAGAAMLQTTIAFTMAKGSDGANVLPQEAKVWANLRFSHHQPTEESIAIITELAKKYDIETKVIYKDNPDPIVDYRSDEFKTVERTINDLFPGVGVVPYPMTGGTDAKFYQEICDNCIRFAPLYINAQQYGSIHGIDENIHARTLTKGVDFFQSIIQNYHTNL
ncbi:carboxypeptidase PM20D1 [Aequitasia blattaphilus]|uniref:M20/M25/M40 family metallo-hydrolase n=1 Tax=Aequitasia blattaphilus TaxID=2949332 RepID=A0ABT1E8B3_9FIRM|nr:M20/M25/M40 family metallo-hydrolase [Aequitasia blattaphilus]MCP1101859.1 M20/M25/M40 family metallo-hydrolase [Aequitasia blattaphilus]MCR8614499.1 M20/M25/M40 family metallo-hydrolase [Aequitasia blattaphilus]